MSGYTLSSACRMALLAAVLLLFPVGSPAYSVLTHEAIIDASWDSTIKPLLLRRFPNSTPEQLREAHSYAYGGCIIQDMGYYPFGSRLFTNLLHYVRTGDFIQIMLRDAQTEDEYAFALGAVAHWYADTIGHSVAINPSVALRYPKLKKKYGNVITYEEGKKEHILVEFSFDVVQLAGKAYASQAYHDFIGFQVAKPLLERAFRETYGLEMKDIFLSEDLAIGTYRRAVSKTIPHMTQVAWSQKRDEIQKLVPGIERKKFIYKISRRTYETDFGKSYERPGFGARLLGFLLRLVPRIGFFRSFSFKPPTPQMESLFQQSFQTTTARYTAAVRQSNAGTVALSNEDFDTGKPTAPGEYALADETYEQLLDKLAGGNFADVPPGLRADILRFYSNSTASGDSKGQKERWEKTQKELAQLRGVSAAEEMLSLPPNAE
jgi:hypothetical protein